MFIEQADGFSMDVAYMKVLPSKSEEIKESTKRGRAASHRALRYWVRTLLGKPS